MVYPPLQAEDFIRGGDGFTPLADAADVLGLSEAETLDECGRGLHEWEERRLHLRPARDSQRARGRLVRFDAAVCDGCGRGGLSVIRIGVAAPALCPCCALPHAKGEPAPSRVVRSDDNEEAKGAVVRNRVKE